MTRNKLVSTIIAISLVLPAALEANTANGAVSQQLQQVIDQKEKVKKQQAQTSQQLSSVKQEKAATQQEADQLQQKLEATSAQLTTLETSLSHLDDDLSKTKEQLTQADKRVTSRSGQLKQMIESMYVNGPQSYLEVLMGSTTFNDFLDRVQDLVLLAGNQKELLAANMRDKQQIEQVEAQQEKDQEQQKALVTQEQNLKQQLAAQEIQKTAELATLNSQEQVLAEQSAEQEKELMQFAAQESKLIEESKKVTLSYQGGKLAWPFSRNYPITSPFGYRSDPFTGERAFHDGTDVGAPKGTDILAAEDGIVSVAQWYGGYGNCVIIDHGHGIMTLYGHMLNDSMVVKKGDTVKRGQKIGEVGMTGRATGYHLHFGVYLNYNAVDPMNYLK
jgi:murein DD-endopeptidase MepM/ murein hydrolase activator NlpD